MLQIIILVALGIGMLFAALWIERWWREQSYDLNGKRILITGGSRGLGLVMARQLGEAGAKLAICARDTAELERARTELELLAYCASKFALVGLSEGMRAELAKEGI